MKGENMNQYKIPRLFNLLLILALYVFSKPCLAYSYITDYQKAIWADINSYRSEHNLPPLKLNQVISEQAQQHSDDMATNKISFGHDGFKVRMSKIFDQLSSKAMAENVAFTSDNARTVVKLWLNSPGHRKNIEGNYNRTGIGIAHDRNGGVYVTQIFLLTDN